jgi:hypothetical protein
VDIIAQRNVENAKDSYFMEIVKRNVEEIIYAITNVKICVKMIVLPVKLNAQ